MIYAVFCLVMSEIDLVWEVRYHVDFLCSISMFRVYLHASYLLYCVIVTESNGSNISVTNMLTVKLWGTFRSWSRWNDCLESSIGRKLKPVRSISRLPYQHLVSETTHPIDQTCHHYRIRNAGCRYTIANRICTRLGFALLWFDYVISWICS